MHDDMKSYDILVRARRGSQNFSFLEWSSKRKKVITVHLELLSADRSKAECGIKVLYLFIIYPHLTVRCSSY